MQLHADFSRRAVVHAGALEWKPSPTVGVDRRMLDRVGGEVARATSIVRYAPRSDFPAHTHSGGEEFFVINGVFTDDRGDYPAGSYVRNPPTSRHSPGSRDGCIIFVKLWQFDPDDRTDVRVHVDFVEAVTSGDVTTQLLFEDAREQVRVETWAPNGSVRTGDTGGLEMLVLDGDLEESGERFIVQSWLRLPIGSVLEARAGPAGCRVLVKTGHLRPSIALPASA